MSSTHDEPQLIPNDPASWTLDPIYYKPKRKGDEVELRHYELRFNGRRQMRVPTSREHFGREVARFLNSRKLVPRDRIECFADAPNPDEARRKSPLINRRHRTT